MAKTRFGESNDERIERVGAVRGGVGADTITISGFDATAVINGNAGNDSIGTTDLATGVALKGGAGNDTITVSWTI